MDMMEVVIKALVVKVHSMVIFRSWDTAKVTDMDICFLSLLRSTKTLGVGTQRK